jgi:hypothetical protein
MLGMAIRVMNPGEPITTYHLARQAEEQARQHPERRDLFLCHAWETERLRDRAVELLKSNAATVWFSERDVRLGNRFCAKSTKGLRRPGSASCW